MSQPEADSTPPPFLTAPELDAQERIVHGFFTRGGGVSRGLYASLNVGLGSRDDRDAVLENRTRVATLLGVTPTALLSAFQYHSAEAIIVSEPWTIEEQPRGDALVTNRPGIALAISTADCGPVLFADPHARVVGAAHAGWRGAFTGVLEATISAMETLGATRKDMTAVLGPTIAQGNYEVDLAFRDRFIAADAENAGFFTGMTRPQHVHFDLPAYIGDRLRKAGIGCVADLARCTYADETAFFSYRRATHRAEPDYGRLMSAIALKGG